MKGFFSKSDKRCESKNSKEVLKNKTNGGTRISKEFVLPRADPNPH